MNRFAPCVRYALVVLLLAAIATVAACASDTSTDVSDSTTRPTLSPGIATAYIQKCGGCHGAVGSEQAAESLASVSGLSPETIETKIRAGGTQMPGFEDSLTDVEIDDIVRYVVENF